MTVAGFTEDLAKTWRADGVVCLRGVFAPEWIELLRQGAEQSVAAPGALAKDYARDGKGKFFTDHDMYLRNDPIRRFVFESPAGEIAARLMGARKVNLVDDHLLIKEPKTSNPTYWHQDQPYYQFAGEQFCSMWIPLDPVNEENGTMRFVRGSHRWGKQFHPVRIGLGELVEEAEDFDGPAPDIDASPGDYDTASWELSPGDCLAFHGKTLHGAYANTSATARRRALSVRFTGDDIRWHPRLYAPTDPNAPKLRAGDPIDGERYPIVWAVSG